MQPAAAASFWLLCVLGTCPLARCGRAGKFAATGASRTLWSPEAPRKAAPAFPQCAGFYFYFLKGGEEGVRTHVWGTRGCISNLGSNAFSPFPLLKKSLLQENGKGVPCFWARRCSKELVQGSPAGVSASFADGSGREEAGEFSLG